MGYRERVRVGSRGRVGSEVGAAIHQVQLSRAISHSKLWDVYVYLCGACDVVMDTHDVACVRTHVFTCCHGMVW